MKKWENMVKIAGGMILAAAGFWMMLQNPDTALPYICLGIGSGIFGHGAGDAVSRAVRNKDPEMAKQVDIEQKDERNIALGNASKAKAFDMMLFVFGALMLAFALMKVSFQVILSLVTAYLFVTGYFIYVRIRMEKQS